MRRYNQYQYLTHVLPSYKLYAVWCIPRSWMRWLGGIFAFADSSEKPSKSANCLMWTGMPDLMVIIQRRGKYSISFVHFNGLYSITVILLATQPKIQHETVWPTIWWFDCITSLQCIGSVGRLVGWSVRRLFAYFPLSFATVINLLTMAFDNLLHISQNFYWKLLLECAVMRYFAFVEVFYPRPR